MDQRDFSTQERRKCLVISWTEKSPLLLDNQNRKRCQSGGCPKRCATFGQERTELGIDVSLPNAITGHKISDQLETQTIAFVELDIEILELCWPWLADAICG